MPFTLIALLIPIALLLYLIYLAAFFLKTRVPYVATPKKYFDNILNKLEIGRDTVIYDLGCGKGDFLFAAEKFKPKKLVGYELSPLHALYGILKAKLAGSEIEIHMADYFKADISQADIIYIFSVPAIALKTWQKVKSEAKAGALAVILSDKLHGEEPYKIFKSLPNAEKSTYVYVYKVARPPSVILNDPS